VRAAAALPETVMVESAGRPYAALDVANAALKARDSKEYSPQTAWDIGFSGAGVIVAVMDTGVDNAHPSLLGKWLGGVDVSKPDTRLTPRDGTYDADDTQGHGTSVSCMAIGTGAPDGVYAGIAPGANLVDLRIGTKLGAAPGEGPLNVYDATLQGINWAIQFKGHSWPGGGTGMDILSLSWGNNVGGSSDGSDMYSRGIDRLVQAGIIAVIAAGNAGPNNDGFDGLGASSFAITIGATDDLNTIDRSDDEIASYSSRGPRADNNDGYPYDELKPEVSAPGTNINSCNFDQFGDGSGNDYGPRGSGTSYATPMVSGTVALMIEANPDLKTNWRLVKEILTHTAERRGNATLPALDPFWNKDFGYGMVDAYRAVLMAKSLKGVTDTVDPELQAFVMSTSASRVPARESVAVSGVSYAKKGTVEAVEMQVDGSPWVRVAAPNDGNQTNFTFSVDTRGFADGNHTVRVRAVSGGVYSLVDEATFRVQGAPPRASEGLAGALTFLAAAVAVSAGLFYYVLRRVLRAREARALRPRENF
jgi:subtilisin family serine protease